ncbi:MAG TPA: hypothetical protein P5525_11110 [Candidatus Paceibacterota bacterium]|nr:hypothetical protein [Candidatus Paceibacterota bacterium]
MSTQAHVSTGGRHETGGVKPAPAKRGGHSRAPRLAAPAATIRLLVGPNLRAEISHLSDGEAAIVSAQMLAAAGRALEELAPPRRPSPDTTATRPHPPYSLGGPAISGDQPGFSHPRGLPSSSTRKDRRRA